eukprot:TRINITY_DN75037_c0_g1_i2.p1 TRINITY_DN75037_c0_g1~~TRINITY_DN75037_c0_g1_i2.p1  ORF type:complete len:351 (-),score=46.78 TRINITY_DN75037_c0_g1_i2:57-1052(-)
MTVGYRPTSRRRRGHQPQRARSPPCRVPAAGGSRTAAAETYRRACARLGRQPAAEVCQDLREHGALVVDLLLSRDVDTLMLFLREAPAGVRQLVLYSGALFFGNDESYRLKWLAAGQRDPLRSALHDGALLRRLACALESFCAVRGPGLLVLELTGVPLGYGTGQQLLAPLARSLAALPSLQRLHFASVGLQDAGLALLLPHLARGLPKLSHLSLARNGLQDVRLIAHLLQCRTSAQLRRQAVPMYILDLSQNPALVYRSRGRKDLLDCSPKASEVPLRFPGASVHDRYARQSRENQARMSLMQAFCEALRGGLVLSSFAAFSSRYYRTHA